MTRRTRALDGLEEDIREHLEQEVADNIARGLSPDEARRAAHRDFGGVAIAREDVRAVWIPVWLDQAAQDLRYAVRMLLRTPGFSLIVIVTLALGIGANTAVFSVANAALFRNLPFDQPDRIVWLDTQDARGRSLGVSLQDFEDWRRNSRTCSGMALLFRPGLTLAGDDRLPDQYPGAYISATGFDLIGAKAAIGRGFREEDDRPGAAPVVLLSDSLWKSRYAGTPTAIGTVVNVAGVPATVIGVMPTGFAFPNGELVWLPMSQLASSLQQRGRQGRFFEAYARLAPGVTIDQARSEFASITGELGRQYPETNKDTSVVMAAIAERLVDPQFRALSWVLTGAVGFVLLIACANVANLLLARAANRSREMALRISLGATRWRVIRQLLVESLLLSCIGGALGLGIAVIGVRWLDAAMIGRAYWMAFTIDTAVLVFFACVCVLTGVLFGLAPALHLLSPRVFGTMFAMFGIVGLILAGVGLYALTAYAVSQRTSEIGVRRALGAQRRHVIWLVVRRAVVQVGVGLAFGMAGAIAVGRLLRAALVQTSPTDLLTLVSTAVILIAVAAVACLVPMRRAIRLDPIAALRHG